MSDFERIFSIEKHHSIEKEDSCTFVHKPPLDNPDLLDETTPLGKKYKKAKEICDNTKTVDIFSRSERELAKGKKKDSGRALKKGSKR